MRVEAGAGSVHAAIDFDDEEDLGADEVSDEAADDDLAAEWEAQTAAFEGGPQALLGEGGVVTKVVRLCGELELAISDVALRSIFSNIGLSRTEEAPVAPITPPAAEANQWLPAVSEQRRLVPTAGPCRSHARSGVRAAAPTGCRACAGDSPHCRGPSLFHQAIAKLRANQTPSSKYGSNHPLQG